MDVVVLADGGYIRPLAVCLQSLLDSHHEIPAGAGDHYLSIYVISRGVHESDARALRDMVARQGSARLEMVEACVLDPTIGEPTSVLPITWQKLHLPKLLLSRGVRRVIYMDADVIVRKNLAPLLIYDDVDEPTVVRAVRDLGLPTGQHLDHDERLAAIWRRGDGGPPRYFNAGLMVLDLEAMESSGSMDAMLKMAHQYQYTFRHGEQDVMNLVLRGRWQALPLTYNAQGLGTYARERIDCGGTMSLSKEEYMELESDPAVVHSSGSAPLTPVNVLNPYVRAPFKPWSLYCPHQPWRHEFFCILDRTPWGGWRPSQDQEDIIQPTVAELTRFALTLEPAPAPPAPPHIHHDEQHTRFNRNLLIHQLGLNLLAHRPKVFGLGLYRTGTSSLGMALSWLGYRTTSTFIPVDTSPLDYFDLDSSTWLPRLAKVEAYLSAMDAFTDCPWLYLYKELDQMLPGSRFILTRRRSTKAVAESEMVHWKELGLDTRYKAETGSEVTMKMFELRYEQHNDKVLQYFKGREEDLLVLCLEDEGELAWAKLCGFLGCMAPPRGIPFPHLNSNKRCSL